MDGWRSLTAPRNRPRGATAGTAPEIWKTQTNSSMPVGRRVVLAPAHIVQGGCGIESHGAPHTVGDQGIEAGALVHFVEVRQRLAGIELAAILLKTGGRSTLFSSPSTRSEAGTMSFNPC